MAETDEKPAETSGKTEVTEAYLKSLRSEAAENRRAAQELKAQLDEIARKDFETKGEYEKAKATLAAELEDAKKQIAAAQQERDDLVKAREQDKFFTKVRSVARKAGILDTAVDDLELLKWDDVDAEDLPDKIAALKETKPHWFKAEKDDKDDKKTERKSSAAPPPRGENGNAGRDYMRMDPAEFRAALEQYGL